MKKTEAKLIAHTLSNPSKMPCKSYSLPIEACITGSKLRKIPGSVCSKCYAGKGCYQFASTKKAVAKRLESITKPNWSKAMVSLIGNSRYFRWHDSGDLQGLDHLQRIIQVAKATPHTKHWLPTKEIGMVRDYVNDGNEIPTNLTIRVSAPMIDSRPLADQGHPQVKTCRSVTAGHDCPAPEQNGECRDCRRCWDTNVNDVAYLMH